jgi:anaerobic selenocysteine-containing dehydrogenase
MTTHYRSCNLCEAICGLEIEVVNNKVVSIRGDANDPLSKGHICPKATALEDVYNDPNRLRHPVRRVGDQWQRISWDEAFTEVVSRLQAIRASHGADAVGSYLGNPTVHNSGTLLTLPGFLRALGSRNRFSATSVDQLPQQLASALMLGHPALLPVPDLERTRFWLILGANPLVSNGSMMTAPGVRERIKGIQARGGRVVVIDPRRTETAAVADEHHFIRPGGDAVLLLAMLHTLFAENLVRLGHLESVADGLEAVRAAAQSFTPDIAARHTGIEADTIRQLARDFAAADGAVAYGRIGLSVQQFGGLCQWLVYLLNIVTGNLDRVGGAMFTTPAFDLVRKRPDYPVFDRYRSRVRDLPEFDGEFPVAALAEEILEPGEGQIRALVTVAGNPVLSTPNGTRLEAALERLEFYVAVDIYVNETTRHADIILPPTTGLETTHYDLAFFNLAVRNVAKWNAPTLNATPDTRHDWQILEELTQRLSGKPVAPTDPAERVDRMLRAGPHDLTLETLQGQPHGIDLGALRPCLPERLMTPNGRLNLAPDFYLSDLERLRSNLETALANGFTLIGRRELRGNNSWMHQVHRLNRDQPRCTMMMHPDDAAHLELTDGAVVRVQSQTSSIEVPLELSADLARGVVSLPHGYGHTRPGLGWAVPPEARGSSYNDLVSHEAVDASGNAALSGVQVRLSLAVR